MNIIDTHTHIYLKEFEEEGILLLDRAKTEGVTKMLLPAIDSTTHRSMLAMEQKYPEQCLSMMGLHPCSVKENYLDELAVVGGHLEQRKFIAVGETGLDFYWEKTFIEQQYNAFRKQIEWALDYKLPVVIHSRESTDECIQVVSEHQDGTLQGVFHCFSGNEMQADKIIGLGFYLGIGGVVTFKNSGLDKVVEKISLDHLVLETDAPYLAPVPFRGKRNEPAYLKYVVEKISDIKGCSIEEVIDKTTKNATKLFGEF